MKATFTILHTNDIHSNLIGIGPASEYTPATLNDDKTIGGIERIATLIAERRFLSVEATLIAPAAAVGGIRRRQPQSAVFVLTHSDSTMCSATYPNGPKIAGTKTTLARQLMAGRRQLAIASGESRVAAIGQTFRGCFGRLRAQDSVRNDIMFWAFVSRRQLGLRHNEATYGQLNCDHDRQ